MFRHSPSRPVIPPSFGLADGAMNSIIVPLNLWRLIALGLEYIEILRVNESSPFWQKAVKAALVLVVFEGAIRKWILPGSSDLVYFLKDIVLLLGYASYFLFEGAKTESDSFFGFKVLLTLAVLIVVF